MMRTPNSYYAVNPEKVSKILSENHEPDVFNTGLLNQDILQVFQKGDTSVVFSYRKPQITGIWIENHDNLLTVPMPGLVLARKSKNSGINYYAVAVKRRPQPGSKIYKAPLPNTQSSSGICWGSVNRPPVEQLANMNEDWIQFLGSAFNSHSVNSKSIRFDDDIRDLLKHLDKKKAKKYPMKDLVSVKTNIRKKKKVLTYAEWAESVCK